MRVITSDTADDLISRVSESIRSSVESGETAFSSEATFRFLFAWQLGRELKFTETYRFDFEWNAYSELDTEDTFLDLLVYTDPSFKIALEFKLPKSSGPYRTNSTQVRAKICRDISRLSYLVQEGHNSVRLAYFLCATDESSYLTEGRKNTNVQYKTYHQCKYAPGFVVPKGEPPNGIARELPFPKHEVQFEWLGVKSKEAISDYLGPVGRFAWLKPIRISA
jgi:hypothetical protein